MVAIILLIILIVTKATTRLQICDGFLNETNCSILVKEFTRQQESDSTKRLQLKTSQRRLGGTFVTQSCIASPIENERKD